MTLNVFIGRRVPKSWFRRTATKIQGFMSFQENLWIIIKQSMNMAKKKANASGNIKWFIMYDKETEDMNYNIEWIKNIIQGDKDGEKEEYEQSLKLYAPFSKLFKKEMPKDENMTKHFKTKLINQGKVEEAYKAGYGSINDNNLK